MSVQLQDRFNDPTLLPDFSTFGSGPQGGQFTGIGSANDYDEVSRFMNPTLLASSNDGSTTGSSSGGGLSSIITQLLSVISQLMSGMGNGINNWSNGSGNQQYFNSASGGSNGDPHLSFNGTTWNDMSSESHLLDSDSIPGGYRLSTQTTAPNANGVTYNQQATVTSSGGTTSVTLDKNGNATYTQDGITSSLANGQTVNLGNGEIAARSQNGTLTITNTSPTGGQITTTLTSNNTGVNANVTANNVSLGGALVNGQNATPPPASHPTPTRYNMYEGGL